QMFPLSLHDALPIWLGVPRVAQRLFFGDDASATAYEAALGRWAQLGASITEIDFEPFYRAARLLYEGPWVAERYLAARSVIASRSEEHTSELQSLAY